MKRFHLTQAVLRTKFGRKNAVHRIVVASDPIDAARECFAQLNDRQKKPGERYPEFFRVWPMRTPESFTEDVGTLEICDDEEDPEGTQLEGIEDMFEPKAIEVRL